MTVALPTGETLWARLYTEVNGAWVYYQDGAEIGGLQMDRDLAGGAGGDVNAGEGLRDLRGWGGGRHGGVRRGCGLGGWHGGGWRLGCGLRRAGGVDGDGSLDLRRG